MEGENLLLHRVAGDQTVGEHAAGLADTVGAVHGLRLHGGVPPGVEDVDVVGRGEVEALAAGLEAHEEQPAVRVLLEADDASLPVGRASVEVFVDRLLLVEPAAEDCQETGELAEDEHLVPLVEHLVELFQQRIELGTRLVHAGVIDQSLMAGGLPQPQQRLEHGDSRAADAHPADPPGEFGPEVLAEFVVGLPLGLAEFDEQRLLGLLRKIGEHLRLRPPQQVGADGAGHDLRAAASVGEKLPQPGGAAELSGVEKFEDAPEFADVVLDRCAGERQAMAGAEQPAGLRRLAGCILDRLGLVEDHVVELGLAVGHDVAAERAVGRDHDVPVSERARLVGPRRARVVGDPQVRREPAGLVHPVEDEAAGHDHERRAVGNAGGTDLGLTSGQESQHLDRLAETHVIGETAAQSERLEKHQPTEPFSLIVSERALEALRLGLRLGPFAGGELLAEAVECLVERGPWLAGEQRVEQRHLDAAVAELAVMLLRERRHGREFLRERVGQDANRAVGQLDRPAATSDRLEQGRQVGRHAAEVDGRREFEPVDAAGDVPGDAACGAVAAACDLDEPAGGGELRHRGVEPVARDFDVVGGGRAVE